MNSDEKIRSAFANKDWQEIKTTDSWQIFKIMAEFVDGFEKIDAIRSDSVRKCTNVIKCSAPVVVFKK